MRGFLVLEDGIILEGEAFGAEKDALGEIVFATGMTGYQESLTDPSYCGQILVSAYPLVGNYGVNPQDSQSGKVQVWGHIVKELCKTPSHRASESTLHELLERDGVPGIAGIDTRALIRRLRMHGTMKGGMTTHDPEGLLERIRNEPHPEESNLVGMVSTKSVKEFEEGKKLTVAVFDCGVKKDIIVELRKRFNVIQLPFDTPEEKVRAFDPDGIFVTNGPGNPAHPDMLSKTVSALRGLSADYPMMGICLGNQLLSLMFGAKTYKLKFGHRGINQPVYHGGRVLITSQNHGFAVDHHSATSAGLDVDFVNLNDGTVEGVRHRSLPIFSVQFHPEAHPGPLDTTFLFDRFLKAMEGP